MTPDIKDGAITTTDPPQYLSPSGKLHCFSEVSVAPSTNPTGTFERASGDGGQRALVSSLKDLGRIKSERVLRVMGDVDRARYSSDDMSLIGHYTPYQDRPQRIGFGATISAPHIHAQMLEELSTLLKPGCTALDVGCGSGYITVCMALLAGDGASVYGVDIIPELVEMSIANTRNDPVGAPLLDELAHAHQSGSVHFSVADGRAGLPEHAPYDVIHVGAAAEEVYDELVQQLKPGGKMVIPVDSVEFQGLFQDMFVVSKDKHAVVSCVSLGAVRFWPLTSAEKQLESASSMGPHGEFEGNLSPRGSMRRRSTQLFFSPEDLVEHVWSEPGPFGLALRSMADDADAPGVLVSKIHHEGLQGVLQVGMRVVQIDGTDVSQVSYRVLMGMLEAKGRPVSISFVTVQTGSRSRSSTTVEESNALLKPQKDSGITVAASGARPRAETAIDRTPGGPVLTI